MENKNAITAEQAKRVEAHDAYMKLVEWYDNVEVGELSDEDLEMFHDLCHNGVIEADEELRRRAAFRVHKNCTRKVPETFYPDVDFASNDDRPVTERVKTFEDACRELGDGHVFVKSYNGYALNIHEAGKSDKDILAYLKLRIIVAALNEGWEPQFAGDEERWYPWFIFYTEDESVFLHEYVKKDCVSCQLDSSGVYCGRVFVNEALEHAAYTDIGGRLALRSRTLAAYAGKQFINLWGCFYFTLK